MKKTILALALAAILTGCGAIDSGNSGVRIALDNEVNMTELPAGFYISVFSSVEEFVGKEIMISLDDMTPKAADNLSMEELDLEVYYIANINNHAELKVKYANATVKDADYYYPAYNLVKGQARSAVYKSVGQMNSLTIHRNREELQNTIQSELQSILDKSDPEVFTITKVIVKKANSDKTLEKAIRINVAKDKELEAKMKEEEIKRAEARANIALDASLTPAILRLRELEVMEKACGEGGSTCIIDFTNGNETNIMPLIQPQRRPAG